MSMYTLLRNKPVPNMEDIDTYFQVRLNSKVESGQLSRGTYDYIIYPDIQISRYENG